MSRRLVNWVKLKLNGPRAFGELGVWCSVSGGKPTEIKLTAIGFPNLFTATTTTTRGCPAPPEDFTQQGRGCPSSGCANGNCCTNALNKNVGLSSFTEAWAVCGTLPDCAHILAYKDGKFYLRKESDPVVPAAAPNGIGADHSRSMEYTCKGMLRPALCRCVGRRNRRPFGYRRALSHSSKLCPMGRTCGEPNEIKKNTNPKNIAGLLLDSALVRARTVLPCPVYN